MISMATEKLEYEVEFPINVKGTEKAIKDIEKLEKRFSKLAKNAQAGAARIAWGATGKPGTMGRTIGNIASKNLLDFLPHRTLGRVGSNVGRSMGQKLWGTSMAADYAEKYQLSRLAKGKSLTSAASLRGVNAAAGKGMAAAGAKGAAMGGMAGGMLGGALMLLPALISIIIASSRMLQRTLGNIMKYLLMFLRPIGDMLAVLMYPLMMILRPLALMVNTILRPFLTEARKSFRLSLQLGKQAKTARSAGLMGTATELDALSKEMMNTGLATLGMGFSKVIINMTGELVKIVAGLFIDIMAFQMNNVATVIKAVTFGAIDLTGAFAGAATEAKAFVESGVDNAIKDFNTYADDFLENVRTKNENVNKLSSATSDFLNNAKELNVDLPLLDTNLSTAISSFKTGGISAFDALIAKTQEWINKINTVPKPSSGAGTGTKITVSTLPTQKYPTDTHTQNTNTLTPDASLFPTFNNAANSSGKITPNMLTNAYWESKGQPSPFKASGGPINSNGMYYLHKGEMVTNPVTSSFNNSGSDSNAGAKVEFNNCTFGSVADWKKEMDKYFNTQMRHIR